MFNCDTKSLRNEKRDELRFVQVRKAARPTKHRQERGRTAPEWRQLMCLVAVASRVYRELNDAKNPIKKKIVLNTVYLQCSIQFLVYNKMIQLYIYSFSYSFPL